MELSKEELTKKFSILKKFENATWFSEEAIKDDCNHKELPLKATLALIEDLLDFIHKTKFKSNWEACFSMEVRLKQIKNLLCHFCEETEEEKTIKGSHLP
jgi:hypothetical protein